MTTLMQASRQWATRPADERYASLLDMQSYMTRRRDRSRAAVESTRALTVTPDQSDPMHPIRRVGFSPGAARPAALGESWAFREHRTMAEVIAAEKSLTA